jgi:hypothetical protein
MAQSVMARVAAVTYQRWGWPAKAVGDLVVMRTGEQAHAINLPAGAGCRVRQALWMDLLNGPIIVIPGSRPRWVFLVRPAEDAADPVIESLRARGAIVSLDGVAVPLPPSRLDAGLARWAVQPPAAQPWLPPFRAVASAIQSITPPVNLAG